MKGCLLIHGFTGSPYEVMPLAEHLRQTTEWKIHTPTLPGHGKQESLRDVNWKDWIEYAERECAKMLQQCEQVFVVGFSMGGFLAAHLAAVYPVKRLVIMSVPVFSPHPQQIVEDVITMIKNPQNVNGDLEADWARYKKKIKNTPVRAVCQFRKLARQLKPMIHNIHVPILIIHGKKDSLANPRGAQYIYEHVQSVEKDILYLKDSKHVVCHDAETETMFAAVDEFIQSGDEQRI